jgi:hypothetical protein
MQSAEIEVAGGSMCSISAPTTISAWLTMKNLRDAAKAALDRYGYGMASVRFICGTQEEHKQLEAKISAFLGMEDTILYSAPVSTPMAGCSRRCSAKKTRSSPTRSTTPRSSTACGSPRPNAFATPTTTWPRWRKS